MAGRSVLYNVLSFAGLVVGVPAVIPHGLNYNGAPAVPRSVAPNAVGFTTTADATNLTVTRTAAASSGTVLVYVEIPNTPDNLPPKPNAIAAPFVFGAGGGSIAGITVQDEGAGIANNPHATVNFVGPGVIASDIAGVATVTIGAGAIKSIVLANSPYTILSTDDVLFVDTSAGAITMILPNPAAFTYAKMFYIKDTTGSFGTNNLTLSPFGAEKIEGLAANKIFQTNWGSWFVMTDGTNWYVWT